MKVPSSIPRINTLTFDNIRKHVEEKYARDADGILSPSSDEFLQCRRESQSTCTVEAQTQSAAALVTPSNRIMEQRQKNIFSQNLVSPLNISVVGCTPPTGTAHSYGATPRPSSSSGSSTDSVRGSNRSILKSAIKSTHNRSGGNRRRRCLMNQPPLRVAVKGKMKSTMSSRTPVSASIAASALPLHGDSNYRHDRRGYSGARMNMKTPVNTRPKCISKSSSSTSSLSLTSTLSSSRTVTKSKRKSFIPPRQYTRQSIWNPSLEIVNTSTAMAAATAATAVTPSPTNAVKNTAKMISICHSEEAEDEDDMAVAVSTIDTKDKSTQKEVINTELSSVKADTSEPTLGVKTTMDPIEPYSENTIEDGSKNLPSHHHHVISIPVMSLKNEFDEEAIIHEDNSIIIPESLLDECLKHIVDDDDNRKGGANEREDGRSFDYLVHSFDLGNFKAMSLDPETNAPHQVGNSPPEQLRLPIQSDDEQTESGTPNISKEEEDNDDRDGIFHQDPDAICSTIEFEALDVHPGENINISSDMNETDDSITGQFRNPMAGDGEGERKPSRILVNREECNDPVAKILMSDDAVEVQYQSYQYRNSFCFSGEHSAFSEVYQAI